MCQIFVIQRGSIDDFLFGGKSILKKFSWHTATKENLGLLGSPEACSPRQFCKSAQDGLAEIAFQDISSLH